MIRDFIQQSVTGAPGTGNFVLGAALTEWSALTVADDGLSFDCTIVEAGLGKEHRTGCVYTHGTLALTRGTLVSSTTGAAISFTAAAVVMVAPGSAFADSLGLKIVPQNAKSVHYNTVLEDSGKHMLHPSADTVAKNFTIPANASVAYPIGTVITFVNQVSAGLMTIRITTDVMRLAGPGTTGDRYLAANGIATALKVTATEWIISGTGLT